MSSNVAVADMDIDDSKATHIVRDGDDEGQANQPLNTADANVNTNASKNKLALKKSSAADGEGAVDSKEKQKAPRKRAPKKPTKSGVDMEGLQDESTEENASEKFIPTPKKRGREAKKLESEAEMGDADVEDVADPATPKATSGKKRTPKSKKDSAGSDVGPAASSSAKKRASVGGAGLLDNGTPSKKPRATYPKTRAELDDADKLMIDLKKQGKSWAEITKAVSTLTGQHYGKSTLPGRYLKVQDVLTEWKDGDIERMLFAHRKVEMDIEEAVAAFKKDAENKSWSTMAKGMVELGANEYTGGAVEKAYIREKKQGFPHRATIATVMAAYPPASGMKAEDGSDAEAAADGADEAEEADGADGLEDLNLDELLDDEV